MKRRLTLLLMMAGLGWGSQPPAPAPATIPAAIAPRLPAQQDETGFQDLFGTGAEDGWRQCGPGHFTLENGVATGHGGMGLWWHTRRPYTNFVLRGEWLQEQDLADSGIFVRFPDPKNDPWVAVHQGHEMEIGDAAPRDPTWRTGAIYPFSAPTSVPVQPHGQWNRYELACVNQTYIVRINGQTVNAWTDPQRRSRSGYIGLQNYADGKTVRHRKLRIRELPAGDDGGPSPLVHAFYYPWYGNPETDGRWANWNHPVAVRQGPPKAFPGGEDIGSNFYPQLGIYSSNNPNDLEKHFQFLKQARVGVICASWWGKGTYTDQALPRLFALAEKHGLQINFHLEPFPNRNAATTLEAIRYLLDRHGTSPALCRLPARSNRPMFYVYDSYLSPAAEWSRLLAPGGPQSIRGTAYDAVVIGLWVKEREAEFMVQGGFDGFYTYFATDGFTYGSSTANWRKLADWARDRGLLFIPCVGPGYVDTRIRPWNGANTRSREEGGYYDRCFAAAIGSQPALVAITSFNEWHEGTQIEPAAPKTIPGFVYQDYRPRPADYYLKRTAWWVGKFDPPPREQ